MYERCPEHENADLRTTGTVSAVIAKALIALALLLAGANALAQSSSPHPVAGAWVGAIEIPGAPLGVLVALEQAGETWTGTIDIPAQGAVGIPLEEISVEEDIVTFRIAGVPGEPTFRGVVEEDSMTGTFAQSGQELPFSLARSSQTAADGVGGVAQEPPLAPEAAPSAQDEAPPASEQAAPPMDDAPSALPGPDAEVGQENEYADPAGRFTVAVPTGWVASEHEGFVRVAGPEGGIRVDVVVSEGDDPEAAVAEAWEQTAPDVSIEPFQTLEPPSEPGVDRTLVMNYDTGDANEIYQAVAQVVGDETYILLIYGELEEVQRRNAQLQIVASSFEMTGVENVDLRGTEARDVSEVVGEFEAFVASAMTAYGIPGAAIAIVQGDEVVYLEGHGATEAGGEDMITATTQMMIGSTGKTMTSMLVATLVDDGIVAWDTPVVEVLPRFAVADEELTQQITIRNLLCACTGVPRRDLELLFNYDELSAEGVVESLRAFEFFTEFGEAFQYSNQLVATAGYVAAAAAGATYGELSEGYRRALNERVLEPIGMENTTLDFDDVLARDEYALPHQLALESGDYEPIALELEALLTPVEPAGAHWSTAEDMARYLLTELNLGVAPDDERVVSEENLLVTWQPQVPLSATESYGLGWIVGEYKGLPWFYHGGNTLGFTSEFTFVPSADLGIAVIANAQGANAFVGVVALRLLELVYDQPAEVEAQSDFQVEQMMISMEEQRELLLDRVPLTEALDYFGSYNNDALGDVSLRLEDGQLLLDSGEWSTQIRPLVDRQGQPNDYVTYGAPLTGLSVRFETAGDGPPTMMLGDGLVSYTFERVR